MTMIRVRTTNEILPALRELISILKTQRQLEIATQLEALISPTACWTTGGEFLDVLDGRIRVIIHSNADSLDPLVLKQFMAISNTIYDSFDDFERRGIRYVPKSSEPPAPPMTLSEWMRDREERR